MRLAAIDAPIAFEGELLVGANDEVRSPISRRRAVVIELSLLERADEERILGRVLLAGDLVLTDEDGTEVLVPRHSLAFEGTIGAEDRPAPALPAELVPFLGRASGRGEIVIRELLVAQGDRVRLEAIVSRASRITAAGASLSPDRLVARGDLGQVVLRNR